MKSHPIVFAIPGFEESQQRRILEILSEPLSTLNAQNEPIYSLVTIYTGIGSQGRHLQPEKGRRMEIERPLLRFHSFGDSEEGGKMATVCCGGG